MGKIKLNQSYWNSRYENNQTGWDIGKISPAIELWLNKQEKKDIKILIPGSGYGYEAAYAHKMGFYNTFYQDLSPLAAKHFRENHPHIPKKNILLGDFFSLKKSNFFDVIIEQTFFCALPLSSRSLYVNKTHELLNESGILIGLLFNITFDGDEPPYGGDSKLYKKLFEDKYHFIKMDISTNSVLPRQGSELWVEMKKKN